MSQAQAPEKPPSKKPTPDPETEERTLRSAYFSILNGFSRVSVDDSAAYIKHFDLRTQTKIDNYYQEIFSKAKKKGLLTEEETLEVLLRDGTWSEKEEEELQRSTAGVEKLEGQMAKAVSTHMKDKMKGALAKATNKRNRFREKKASLVTNTCEQFAERRSSDLIVKLSFYKEDKKALLFTDEEFDLLDREDLGVLVMEYNKAVGPISSENIQKISIADFFTSYFSLVADNMDGFFGCPIHELTFFQVNLLNYAKLFSSILKNLDPPEHIRKHPKQLLEFAKSQSKKQEQAKRKQKMQQDKGPSTLSGK